MKKLVLLISFLSAVGCASASSRMNHLSLGMAKKEVLDVMGSPDSTKAKDGQEILVYDQIDRPFAAPAIERQYWVTLSYGHVSQYGLAGDYGSAAPPTQHIIIDKTETVTNGN